MPLGLGGSPYWTPLTPGYNDQALSDWSKTILEQAPDTAWYRYGRQLGVADDNSAFSQWFKKQYGNYLQGYQAYTVENPLTANITDYTGGLGDLSQWSKQFNALDPRLRGLDPSGRGGGPARWIAR